MCRPCVALHSVVKRQLQTKHDVMKMTGVCFENWIFWYFAKATVRQIMQNSRCGGMNFEVPKSKEKQHKNGVIYGVLNHRDLVSWNNRTEKRATLKKSSAKILKSGEMSIFGYFAIALATQTWKSGRVCLGEAINCINQITVFLCIDFLCIDSKGILVLF